MRPGNYPIATTHYVCVACGWTAVRHSAEPAPQHCPWCQGAVCVQPPGELGKPQPRRRREVALV